MVTLLNPKMMRKYERVLGYRAKSWKMVYECVSSYAIMASKPPLD